MPEQLAITLQHVNKVFHVKEQTVQILRDINVTIPQGDFAIVFGPSGCGKSTMLHIILGLEAPTTGSARFFDWNMYAYSEDDRSEFRKNTIGMIYQQPNWIKSLSVVENVAFAISLLGVEKAAALQKAHATLKKVGLEDWADYYPTELSSGQQQKVALARALVTDPKVIIADEPTGNLDYQSGVELMSLLKQLNEQGTTIILVTHNIENVEYAKTVIQMFNGEVVRSIATQGKSLSTLKQLLLTKLTPPAQPQVVAGVPQTQPPKTKSRERLHVSWRSLIQWRTQLPIILKNFIQVSRFLSLLVVYLTAKVTQKLFKRIPTIARKLNTFFPRLIRLLEAHTLKTISKADLIELSLKNMLAKRTRTAITVGGMTIGVASIVFLISIGYGLEKLVISRVARLEEMRQIDAIPAVATNVKLNDAAVAAFDNINGVTKVLPVVGVVGKITYQNANTDVAVYGVLEDYLKESAIQPSEGSIFTTTPRSASNPSSAQVAGVQDDVSEPDDTEAAYNQEQGVVEYTVTPGAYIKVRSEPSRSGAVLGYTKSSESRTATRLWGGSYSDAAVGAVATDADGSKLGWWLQDDVPLWEETTDETGATIYRELLDDSGAQVEVKGYFAQLNMTVTELSDDTVAAGAVLGESDDFIELAEIDATASLSAEASTKQITLTNDVSRQAVVNKSFLRVLGINEAEGVGKTFSLSYIATEDLLADGQKIVSAPTEYTIVGVTPDNKTPILYVPLSDVKLLGISAYSQAKVVLDNQDILPETRKQIELLGFKTTSVVDTVSQIENLFGTLRILLGILGVVALAVAALGMLNTLTVSLLERTHEVGMMKAIGMKSQEVKNLFLTESMIMGFLGGVGGLIVGYLAGNITSVALSALAISRGYDYIDITFIPPSFVLLILIISLIVGLLTGIYPAKRATKISALDALRYE